MKFYLSEPITKLDQTLVPDGFSGSVSEVRLVQSELTLMINELGERSAKAQGLNKIITTAEKLRQSNHTLYLAVDLATGRGDGFLKVGRKHLYLQDPTNTVVQMEPMCILDFYVVEERQRLGIGKHLFDYMLQDLMEDPERMAIDGPSPKLVSFMKKHYNINTLAKQSNNFAIASEFFKHYKQNNGSSSTRNETRTTLPGPSGRYTAARPKCAVGLIIHGDPAMSKAGDGSSTPRILHFETPEDVENDYITEEPTERSLILNVDGQNDTMIQEPELEFDMASEASSERIVEYILPSGARSCTSAHPGETPKPNKGRRTNKSYKDLTHCHTKLW